MQIFRKTIYKLFAISLLAISASFLLSSDSFAKKSYPTQSQAFYVNDLAEVIDTDTEQYIIDSNKKLAPKTGAQIVVMTVKNLDGEAIEEYAHGVFEQYGIGAADRNNGTLILLSIEDRQSRIELGRGTEGFITDAESGRIQDYYMIPDFKNNNWNNGLRKGFDAILARYEKEYEIDISDSAIIEEMTDNEEEIEREAYLYFSIFIVSAILARTLKIFKKTRYIPIFTGLGLVVIGIAFSSLMSGIIAGIIYAAGFGLIIGATFTLSDFLSSGGHYHSGGSYSSGESSGSHGGGGHSSGGGSSRSF